MRIEDHTSGCVAHMAVLAGKLWFLGKSRSNPLCMGEWVGCGCCLVRLNVAFRELSNTWKLLGVDGPCQPQWVSISGKLWFWSTHPCGWQGPSTPSNFQVFDSSLNATFSRTRQHPQPTHSPMHNGLDLDFPRNQSFPARTAIWATHPLVWSSILTRPPTP